MTVRRWVGAGLAMALSAAPLVASATQSGPPEKTAPEVSGVTVTPAPKPDPLVNPASQFVRLHIPQSQSEQLARFRDAICVSVQGLPPEFDAFVAKRIVDLAKQVHAPVAPAADCLANVNVIFSAHPQAQINDIAKRKDVLIGFHYMAQFQKVTTFDRQIEAWYVTRTRDSTGNSWIEVTHPCPFEGDTSNPCAERPRGLAGSRLSNGMSAEIVHTLIIADANRVAGEKIDAVADYIAVLALAKWQNLEKCSHAVPTILNLMADGCEAEDRPQAATGVDVALLAGLYAVQARELGTQQRMTIASRMQSELNKGEKGAAR
jgi:hypothetical protein